LKIKNSLKLVKLLLIRNLKEEKFLTFLSIFGVSLGIALFIAVNVASNRAVESLKADVTAVNPYAKYQVISKYGIDFDENVYGKLLKIEENSFPVLKTVVYFPKFKEITQIYGVDTVKTLKYMNIKIKTDEFLNFYENLNAVFVPESFLEEKDLSIGDIVHAVIYDREYDLKIVGSYDSDFNSNKIFMDIGNFQELFNKSGYLSFIDVQTDKISKIKNLPIIQKNGLSIEEKQKLIKNQQSIVASFNYNLKFISFVAVLVGIFLLYNTIFITVVKKRTEIGILRSIGTGKNTILFLFTTQGMILGVLGSIFGIFLGQVLAYFSVIAVEKTLSTVYSAVSISSYIISVNDVLSALALGVLISFLASVIPAYEATKIRPAETSREGSFERRYQDKYKFVALSGMILVISGLGLATYEYFYTPFEFPFLSYIGVLLLLIGFTFLTPLFLQLFIYIFKKPITKLFKSIGIITLGDIEGNIYRFSVAVMSIAISTALIFSMVVLIFSFRNSLKTWLDKSLTADIYIKPASCISNFCFYPLSNSVVKIVENLPEVEDTYKFRALQVRVKDSTAIAGFTNSEVMKKYFKLEYLDRKDREKALDELKENQEVAISEYLRKIYGFKRGDKITLDTLEGKKDFVVNGVFLSYSTTSGLLIMDRKWLKKYWKLDDVTQISLFLKKSVDSKEFEKKLKSSLISNGNYSLEILNNKEIRKKIFKIFDRSFAITYAIEFIAIVISLIGIANTLLAFVIERKREISILRYLGGSWNQIKGVLILSAGISAMSGIFLGVVLGLLISIIFIKVVNQISFGWIVNYQIPFLFIFLLTIILFVSTTVAGFFPSAIAKKIDPKRFISFE
jgi:putative ABC transport system permease protein